MADKKLTTQDILALARKQGAEGDSASSDSAAEPQQDAPQADSAPAEDSTKESAPAKPSSTADILAAARAQGSGSEAKESAPAKPAAKPSSTADILAAARAKGGGAAPAKKPGSTSDILAAARAQGGGGGAAPAKKEAPAAKAKPAAAKAPTGDKPALKDMVAAVKQSQSGQPVPKLPAKPVPAKPKLPAKKEMTRRRFVDLLPAIAITPFAAAWAAVAAIGGLWSLGIARFMMPNMVLELPSKFKVGPASDFPPETVSEKFKASRGVWIVNTAQYNGKQLIYALLSICTHLGCTPNWLSGEQKYKCPCHGSGFYIDGINFEGPAPRPLERVGIRVAEDGSLEVDKSLKFQEELGQWGDPKSFVEVV